MDDATSPLQEIAEVARTARRFRMAAEFDLTQTKRLLVSAESFVIDGTPAWSLGMGEQTGRRYDGRAVHAVDLVDAMRQVAASYPNATLRPDSVAVSVEKGPTTAAKLRAVVVRAWHEIYGQALPDPEELAAREKARKSAQKAAEAALVALLKSGPAGAADLNRRPLEERAALDLRRADLAGARLDGAEFGGANLEGADLRGASLVKAKFNDGPYGSRLKEARLVGADLRGAKIGGCQGLDADFSGANLAGAWLGGSRWVRAKFVGADLSGATLTASDLRGADFTDAELGGLALEWGQFDETTRWPAGYLPPSRVIWKGTGPDPRLAAPAGEPPPADLPGLLERLRAATDRAKLDKALEMLRAERFQLFARLADDHLVGVVRSQSNPSLVYACRLADDGRYACCTQNLNVCGGLRGTPCKHLLVLVLGMAQAGQLEPGTAHAWARASRGRKPELDRDTMAEVFLRYKGAEAGEIDWRPTETVPEDFYVM